MGWSFDAGDGTVVRKRFGGRAELITVAWTSDASGVVTVTGLELGGALTSLMTDPDGDVAPSANYDITLTDEGAQDVLQGVGANRHTQVVGFSEQRSSEQIEKRGQLAAVKASFSLEAVSVATCQHGVPPAWYMIARRGLGRRGQVLNWIGAKRYEALRRKRR